MSATELKEEYLDLYGRYLCRQLNKAAINRMLVIARLLGI